MSVRPFDSFTHYEAWVARNCRYCVKWNPHAAGDCEIDVEVGVAAFGSGHVSDEIADRMGYTAAHADTDGGRQFPWTWQCPEREEP